MIYLFDIDGTLLLSGGAGSQAIERAYAERHGVPNAMAGIRPAGKTDPAIVIEAYWQAFGVAPRPQEVERLIEAYLSELPRALARARGFRLLPGVPAVLDRLEAAGHLLGLATGNVRDGARLKLSHGGIWERFRFGGFGDDAVERSALVQLAAERGAASARIPLVPKEVVVVGDTPYDVAAARANGFRAVAVSSGPVAAATLRACDPDRLLSSLEAL